MSQEFQNRYLLIPLAWRKGLLVARLAVAVACAHEGYRIWFWQERIELALIGAFLTVALVAMFWEKPQRPPLALYALGLDTAFLVVFLWSKMFISTWLPALWFVYILSSGVLLHSWKFLPILIAACALGLAKNSDLWPLCAPVAMLGVVAAGLKRQFEDRLFKLSRELVMYRAEAQVAREAERERIAADLHDGPLQSFVSVQMRLEVVRRTFLKNFEKGMKELESLQELWKRQIDSVREFIIAIRKQAEPAPEDLAIALSHLVTAFEKESSVDVEFSGEADLERLPAQNSREILQMVREALHNIHKHAQATRVNLRVQDEDRTLEIVIGDNGKGFPFSGRYTLQELEVLRCGPASILRRARNLGATLTLESGPSLGSKLEIRIPR